MEDYAMSEQVETRFGIQKKLTPNFVNKVIDFLFAEKIGFFGYAKTKKAFFKDFERVPCFSNTKEESISDKNGLNPLRKDAVAEIVKQGGGLGFLADNEFNFDILFNKTEKPGTVYINIVVFATSQLLDEKNKKILHSIALSLYNFLKTQSTNQKVEVIDEWKLLKWTTKLALF